MGAPSSTCCCQLVRTTTLPTCEVSNTRNPPPTPPDKDQTMLQMSAAESWGALPCQLVQPTTLGCFPRLLPSPEKDSTMLQMSAAESSGMARTAAAASASRNAASWMPVTAAARDTDGTPWREDVRGRRSAGGGKSTGRAVAYWTRATAAARTIHPLAVGSSGPLCTCSHQPPP